MVSKAIYVFRSLIGSKQLSGDFRSLKYRILLLCFVEHSPVLILLHKKIFLYMKFSIRNTRVALSVYKPCILDEVFHLFFSI